MSDDEAEFWFPTVDDILAIHDSVIREDSDATPGIEDADRIRFVLDYVETGHFGAVPEAIHEKAFHLMRLLAANHWFADGNKRTALNSTELFYLFNGYEFRYGEDIRAMLKLLSIREALIDETEAIRYFGDCTTPHSQSEDIVFSQLTGSAYRLDSKSIHHKD